MSSTRGFALIEILVVIVVIAILATLVAPNVFQPVGAAKDGTLSPARERLRQPAEGGPAERDRQHRVPA